MDERLPPLRSFDPNLRFWHIFNVFLNQMKSSQDQLTNIYQNINDNNLVQFEQSLNALKMKSGILGDFNKKRDINWNNLVLDPKTQDTFLHIASRLGRVEMVKMLLKENAPVDVFNRLAQSPLEEIASLAISRGNEGDNEDNFKIIHLLLKAGSGLYGSSADESIEYNDLLTFANKNSQTEIANILMDKLNPPKFLEIGTEKADKIIAQLKREEEEVNEKTPELLKEEEAHFLNPLKQKKGKNSDLTLNFPPQPHVRNVQKSSPLKHSFEEVEIL
jgi:ankyrin repeat protein